MQGAGGVTVNKEDKKGAAAARDAIVYVGQIQITGGDVGSMLSVMAATATASEGKKLASSQIKEAPAARRRVEGADGALSKKEVLQMVTLRGGLRQTPKAAVPVVEGIAGGDDDKRAANMHDDDGKVQINGAVGNEQAPAVATVPDDGGKKTTGSEDLIKEMMSALPSEEEAGEGEPEEEMFQEVAARAGRCRTPKAAVPVVEGAAGDDNKRAANMHEGDGKVQINGAVGNEQAPAVATVPDDGGKKTTGSEDLIKEMMSALPSKEEAGEGEPEEEVFQVVAAPGGSRRTVAAAQTPKEAAPVVAEGASGANMWALLNDNDPGHGGANPAKRRRNKKKKKKKNAAGSSNQETVAVDDEEEAPARELEEEMISEDKGEMTGEAATGSRICRTVASFVCGAAAAVVVLASMSMVLEVRYF